MRQRSILPICLLVAVAMSPGRASAAEITVAESNDGRSYLTISGQITREDGKKFRTLATSRDADTVFLASPGGSINAAIEIGKMVRLKRMTTIVVSQDYCASACGLIWLAGERRLLTAKARVGFHTTYIYRDGIRRASAIGNAVVGRYIAFLNLPTQAFAFATAAGPDEVNWLDGTNKRFSGIELELLESAIDSSPEATAALATSTGLMRASINRTATGRQTFQNQLHVARSARDFGG
jgi:hypothetical protein